MSIKIPDVTMRKLLKASEFQLLQLFQENIRGFGLADRPSPAISARSQEAIHFPATDDLAKLWRPLKTRYVDNKERDEVETLKLKIQELSDAYCEKVALETNSPPKLPELPQHARIALYLRYVEPNTLSLNELLSAGDAEFAAAVEHARKRTASPEYVERVALARVARGDVPSRGHRMGLPSDHTSLDLLDLHTERHSKNLKQLGVSYEQSRQQLLAKLLAFEQEKQRGETKASLRFCADALYVNPQLASALRQDLPGARETILAKLLPKEDKRPDDRPNEHSAQSVILVDFGHTNSDGMPKINYDEFKHQLESLARSLDADPGLAQYLLTTSPGDCQRLCDGLQGEFPEECQLQRRTFPVTAEVIPGMRPLTDVTSGDIDIAKLFFVWFDEHLKQTPREVLQEVLSTYLDSWKGVDFGSHSANLAFASNVNSRMSEVGVLAACPGPKDKGPCIRSPNESDQDGIGKPVLAHFRCKKHDRYDHGVFYFEHSDGKHIPHGWVAVVPSITLVSTNDGQPITSLPITA